LRLKSLKSKEQRASSQNLQVLIKKKCIFLFIWQLTYLDQEATAKGPFRSLSQAAIYLLSV